MIIVVNLSGYLSAYFYRFLLFVFYNLTILSEAMNILNGAMNELILQCCVTRERVEIMLQFQTLGVVSCSKMNLVGALRRSFSEFPNSFQKRREKPKKN
ncbi:Uncharacterized protein FWK35_00021107 [Aphis craccivora]|uniref:Uncharacterized protein n=1 Tax=Aphis craccivora TaxID=307492 RepID=A0A6G0YIJ0_APHCR|nr:Uncharacterized protein FWK35_00021107 [Aphis craccivora]